MTVSLDQKQAQILTHSRKFIEPILKQLKTHLWEDIVWGIENGYFFLYSFEKSALVCEFVNYPRLKALNIFLAGGDLKELKSIQPDLIKWAKENGVSRIEIRGRLGWLKTFRNELDSDKTYIQISKDI